MPTTRRCYNSVGQDHGSAEALDHAVDHGMRNQRSLTARPVLLSMPVRNVNRTVGTTARQRRHQGVRGGGLARRHHRHQLPRFGRPELRGLCSRAESRCASKATPTTTLARASAVGGSSCYPDRDRTFVAEDNVIAGNVIGYGATGRRDIPARRRRRTLLCSKFRRHRSVEGVGDHGCEYMTGGRLSSSARPGATSPPA